MAGMGDLKVAEQKGYDQAHSAIIKACTACFDSAHKKDCSGFVHAVGLRLGVFISGSANAIFDEISKKDKGWLQLGSGGTGAVAGAYHASQGFFVIAAWKNQSGHGHVAVVTDLAEILKSTKTVSDRNVAASWGCLDGEELAQNHGPIRMSFGVNKRSSTVYAAKYISAFG